MNIKFKKIIAREFILFVIISLAGLISFSSIFFYNSYQKIRIKEINTEILVVSKKNVSLNYTLAVDPINELFDVLEKRKLFNDEDVLRKMLEKDPHRVYIIISNDSVFKNLFLDYSDFENILNLKILGKTRNIITTKDSLQRLLSELKKQEIILTGKLFTNREQVSYSLTVIYFAFIVLFLIRYLIYGVKWSIHTLQIK